MKELEHEVNKALGRYRQLYIWTHDDQTYVATVNEGNVGKAQKVNLAKDLALAELNLRGMGGKILYRTLPKKYWDDAGYKP